MVQAPAGKSSKRLADQRRGPRREETRIHPRSQGGSNLKKGLEKRRRRYRGFDKHVEHNHVYISDRQGIAEVQGLSAELHAIGTRACKKSSSIRLCEKWRLFSLHRKALHTHRRNHQRRSPTGNGQALGSEKKVSKREGDDIEVSTNTWSTIMSTFLIARESLKCKACPQSCMLSVREHARSHQASDAQAHPLSALCWLRRTPTLAHKLAAATVSEVHDPP